MCRHTIRSPRPHLDSVYVDSCLRIATSYPTVRTTEITATIPSLRHGNNKQSSHHSLHFCAMKADLSAITRGRYHPLLNLNAQLAKVLLIPHVLVRLLRLVEREDLFIDDGFDVVGFNGAVHFFELQAAADEDAADGADVVLDRC